MFAGDTTVSGTALAAAFAALAVLVPMTWYLLRELRSEMRGLNHTISELTLAIALDVSTRPSANERTRQAAQQLVDSARARLASHGGGVIA